MKRVQLQNAGAQRITHFINRYPAVNFHHATRYAEIIGLPLNRFVTINFTSLRCPEEQAAQLLQKLIAQRFAPWLRRTADLKIPLTYVWCMEAAGAQMAAHIIVHIPREIIDSFEEKLVAWLCGLMGVQKLPQGTLNIKPVSNVVGLRHYLLKGVDPVWAAHLGVRPVSQGRVVGKRTGFSRNLGPAARVRGGYRPKRRTVFA